MCPILTVHFPYSKNFSVQFVVFKPLNYCFEGHIYKDNWRLKRIFSRVRYYSSIYFGKAYTDIGCADHPANFSGSVLIIIYRVTLSSMACPQIRVFVIKAWENRMV